MNADTDEDIRTLDEGDVFVKPADMNINIRYNPAATALSVVFKHNDMTVRKENAAPFALAGGRSGDYLPWAQATPGEHTIEATPYDQLDRMGTAGETLVIHFTIEETGNETFARSNEFFSQLSIYPKPAKSHETELSIAGFEGIKQPMVTEVKIIKLTGEFVFSDKISCGGDCGSYLIQVNEQLVPGLYMVNMKTNGLRLSERLLVR